MKTIRMGLQNLSHSNPISRSLLESRIWNQSKKSPHDVRLLVDRFEEHYDELVTQYGMQFVEDAKLEYTETAGVTLTCDIDLIAETKVYIACRDFCRKFQ